MSAFACIFRFDGNPVQEPDLARPMRALAARGDVRLVAAGPFGAVVGADGTGLRPRMAQRGALVGVGDVRLDNRAEVEGWARGPLAPGASDLEAVLAALEARGHACVTGLRGDFAFAAWDRQARTLVAARDALGVKPLFQATRNQYLAFASVPGVLAEEGRYDLEYVADYLVGSVSHGARTVWADVSTFPAGTLLRHDGATGREERFWSADRFEAASDAVDDVRAARLAGEFRDAFFTAVQRRIADGPGAWAQLSGGLDSSSVVCAAARLTEAGRVPAGLGGTVTVVDSLGEGDERVYSDRVVERTGVRNELLVDHWLFEDDGREPPLLDEPHPFYPFYARDRHMAEVVRAGGGRVVLSGLGSDHYLSGNYGYLADLAARGRFAEAVREVSGWAVETRGSFWRLARRYLLVPFLPRPVQARFARPWQQVPGWLEGGFVRRTGMEGRVPSLRGMAVRPGRRFAHEVAHEVGTLSTWAGRGLADSGLEMRYPFLDRDLVELSLRLPVSMRIRPGGQKWVLREAMRGVLPEEVRTRRGKGGIDARILWSLNRESSLLGELLRDPILAQLGCVDPHALRAAVERARRGHVANLAFLLCTLSLEAWLAVRAGRYPRCGAACATAA